MRLTPTETDVLRPLLAQMLELLESVDEPDGLRRLFPPAYEEDAQAEEEFRRFTRDELREAKRRSLRIADSTFDRMQVRRGRLAVRLDGDEAQAWLSSLNDVRLYLGTRLDVTEEVVESSDPAMQIYQHLGWLEECLLDTLL